MIDHLEIDSKLADARLDVAEELGWPVAVLAGVAVYLFLGNWWLPVLAVPITYFGVTYRYRRNAELAEDKYFRAAGLGKYVDATRAQIDTIDS